MWRYTLPRSSGRYKSIGVWPEDRRGLGPIASRMVRAIEKAGVHKLLTYVEESTTTYHLVDLEGYGSPPEHLRNCDLPRCPVCHWAVKGWGTEQEAIASWRAVCTR